MQDKTLFEYAVIRVVPRVEREEFLNVGVIVYCAAQRFLQIKYVIEPNRLLACCANVNVRELEERLQAFEAVCKGTEVGGPIALLPLASRFRWLTALRSTVVQTSAVHPGLCENAHHKLDQLFESLVL